MKVEKSKSKDKQIRNKSSSHDKKSKAEVLRAQIKVKPDTNHVSKAFIKKFKPQ